MDVMEAIKTRRTIRRFAERPIDRKDIDRILDAARWAPSGKNTQPWRFIVVTDPQVRAKLEAMRPQGVIGRAPVTIAILRDLTAGYQELKDLQGIGACAQTLLLAAHALGIGGCWIGLARDAKAHEILGVRDTEELMMVVSLGYPAESCEVPRRLELEELVRYV